METDRGYFFDKPVPRETVPRFLVTGLNGLVGWHVFDYLRQRHETFGTYRKGHETFRSGSFRRIDLESEDEVMGLMREIKPEYFFHAWALCDLDLCEDRPDMARRINIEGTRIMLRAARKVKNLKKFIYLSTDHVFDGNRGGYVETDSPRPKHVYGNTKREAELMVESSYA